MIKTKDAEIQIDELGSGKRRVAVHLADPSRYMPSGVWETAYPTELIEQIHNAVGSAFLIDEIRRDEDESYVARYLTNCILAHVPAADFAGKRVLDFGCGSGASSMSLTRLFPDTEIVGVELEERLLAIARARAMFYGFSSIKFHLSPGGDELPADVGEFDFVVMRGVYEHLLPNERLTVMPLLWSALRPGGILFIDQTPNRHFFMETHTTQLPLLNYVPDGMAMKLARRFSGRIDPAEPWEMLLRRGIRGGTRREIVRMIRGGSSGAKPVLLKASQPGFRDEIDIWYRQPSGDRRPTFKRWLRRLLKAVRYTTGVPLVPSLSLAIRKGQE